jgi:hypothetical protein
VVLTLSTWVRAAVASKFECHSFRQVYVGQKNDLLELAVVCCPVQVDTASRRMGCIFHHLRTSALPDTKKQIQAEEEV